MRSLYNLTETYVPNYVIITYSWRSDFFLFTETTWASECRQTVLGVCYSSGLLGGGWWWWWWLVVVVVVLVVVVLLLLPLNMNIF